MQPHTSAITIDPCKHCGTGAPVDVHFCPRCDRILTLGRHGDYFTFFGLRRRLHLDLKDLEQRFRALSRLFHPDYFHNSTSTERLASLERSSYLNDAFRTLRDPMARLEYLLKLEGFTPKESRDATTKVPQGLLEEVFELNEELEAIQDMRPRGLRVRRSRCACTLPASRSRRTCRARRTARRADGDARRAPRGGRRRGPA
jgi:molecular chaperone HscB